ncbi:hypothetical protein NOCARDAX2BIS_250036 [Nocardioides sp. AX2bis]|nr:hypothetical protein NOCARDAX2BIS_250036 [Nocardioides sp. AX2bis]
MFWVGCKDRTGRGRMRYVRTNAQGRDGEAFAQFYRQHYGHVTAYVRRRSQGDTDAITSAVFTIAWQKYDCALRDGLPWLYRTAQLELRNSRRSDSRREAREERDARVGAGRLDEVADSVTQQLWARRLLEQLSDTDQEVLMLLYWEDLDHTSAAKALGCSVGAFAVRAHRARGKFARLVRADSAHGTHPIQTPHTIPSEEVQSCATTPPAN